MTTIACNKEEMYGDKQFTTIATGDKFRGKTKVYKYEAFEGIYDCPFIVGYAGSANDIITVHSFFAHPEMFSKPPKAPDALTGLVLTADKHIFVFTNYMQWLVVDEPFHAIGSGSGYAMGAMAAGASPLDAVKLAAKHDAYTGFGYKGHSFD